MSQDLPTAGDIDGLKKWGRASESTQKEALVWQEIIEAFAERANGRKLKEVEPEFVLQYNFRNVFLPISRDTYDLVPKISLSTLRRKMAKYKASGLSGLLRAPIRGKPPKKLTTEMQDFILGLMAKRPHIRVSRIWDYGEARFGRSNWPSYRTVVRFRNYLEIEHRDLLLFNRNPDEWKSRNQAAFGDASAKAKHFLHIVELDATKGEIDFQGQRYNFTFAVDDFSKKMKVQLSPTGNSFDLCSLLRRIVLDWGKPDIIIVDNGAEFVSHHFKAVCEALGIKIIYAPKFSPDRKPFVERAIWSVEMMFLEEMQGYLGHNVSERKDIEARRSFAQRMMKRGEVLQCQLSPREFQEIINAWVETIYHQRHHRGIGMSPEAKAATSPRPVKKLQDPRVLDVLLSPVGERVIGKKGIFYENQQYINVELAEHIGERVKVRQDLADIGRLYVFTLQEEFLCIARDTSIEGVSVEEAKEVKKRQRVRLREERKSLKCLSESVGDPMLDLLESKKNRPGQVQALPFEEPFENETIRQIGRGVKKCMEEEEDELLPEAAVGGGNPLRCFLADEPKKKESQPLRIINFDAEEML